MDLARFMQRRSGDWNQLELLLGAVEEGGVWSLGPDRLRTFGGLYRAASSDLIYARTILQNAELGDYLNGLVARAYAVIYPNARFSLAAIGRFFTVGVPRAFRRRLGWVALSTGFFMVGLMVGGGTVLADPDAFFAFVPDEYHDLYGNRQHDLRTRRFGDMTAAQSAQFSTLLMMNNIRVALLAFAVGAAFGFFTAVLIFYNGVLLGAIAANALRWDLSLEFWSMIIPHGVVEIFSICLAGAAGLALGGALLRPGRRTRAEAFRIVASDVVPLVAGLVPVLVVAAVVEGFVTPARFLGPWAKIALGVLLGSALAAYLAAAGRRETADA